MSRDVEEQIGEDKRSRPAMEEYYLVEGRECMHERLIDFAGPSKGRTIT